ncbi:MAG: 50S ribosomal protein L21e [Candidatus Nanoarchaeia archaeon]
MVQRIGGIRRKTRNKFKKGYRDKGKLSIRKYMQNFEQGDKVSLSADSAVQKGLYPPRFHGKIGCVNGKKGWCYEVAVKDGGKLKCVIVHPVHLKKV